MTTFVGSPNSRYYVGVRGDELFFAKEDTVAWHKKIPFEVFQVVAVGGNGNVYLRAPEGIYSYDLAGRELASPIERWSRKALGATSSQLGHVKVSADGRSLCVERATLQTRLSQKIFEFLSSNKVEANTTIHEIFFYNVAEDNEKSFYRCMSSTRSPQKFLWDISIDFQWIVLAEPEKKSTQIRFSVAHVPSQTIYHEFAIPNIRINAVHVSRDGTALVDVTQKGERGIVIVTLDSVKYNLTVPSMDFSVRHIGKDFVAIMTHTTPFLLIKGFDDRLRSQADMRPLESLGIDFEVSFNERDAIDLMSLARNTFKVVHTNVEFLETDARRWEQISQEREAAAEAERNPQPDTRPKVERPQKIEFESRATMEPMVGVDGMTQGVEQTNPPLIDPVPPRERLPVAEPTRPYVPGKKAPEPPPYVEEERVYADENYRYIDETPPRPAPPVAEPPPTRRVAAPPPAAPRAPLPAPSRREPIASPRPAAAAGDNGAIHAAPPPTRPPRVIEVPGRKTPAASAPPPAKKSEPPAAVTSVESTGRARRPAAIEPIPASSPAAAAKAPTPAVETTRLASPPARPSAPKSAPAVAKAPAAAKTPAASKAPAAAVTLDETERRRIQRLLELLEERFVQGQVSESTYADLKAKYTARLGL